MTPIPSRPADPEHRAAPTTGGAPAAADVLSLSPVERWRRALSALAKVLADPGRTDQVLEFSIHANAGTMARRVKRVLGDPEGRRLYEERRAIDSKTIELDALGRLPEGTLGRAYADFMRSRGLTPEIFDGTPSQLSDPRMAYAVQRLRQTHDLWHVVTGYETDPASEIALQAFTFAQVRAPSSLILATAGTVHHGRGHRGLPRAVVAAFRAGLRAEKLAMFPWEDHWETPLAEVRVMLGIGSPVVAAAAA
jgi:ubiquinone biosynthesis protein COQ4